MLNALPSMLPFSRNHSGGSDVLCSSQLCGALFDVHLSPVSHSLASTVQTFPATSSICSAVLYMFVVCVLRVDRILFLYVR